MQQPTSADLIIAVLKREVQELDDDRLATATGINRHYVNALCRRLAADGVISRLVGPSGKLVNRLTGPPQVPNAAEILMPAPRRRGGRVGVRDLQGTRIAELISRFSFYVAAFEAREAFPGPSLYFHTRAIERRRQHASVLQSH